MVTSSSILWTGLANEYNSLIPKYTHQVQLPSNILPSSNRYLTSTRHPHILQQQILAMNGVQGVKTPSTNVILFSSECSIC